MIPVARMDPNLVLVSEGDLLAQCKVCLKNFEPDVEKNQFKAFASHHALLRFSSGMGGKHLVI